MIAINEKSTTIGIQWEDRSAEAVNGTSGDDYFDSAGGNDVIDGGAGTDTLLIFEPASRFTVTTLAGLTKIEGNYNAGDYAYYTITTTNVEKVQFSDSTTTLDTTAETIISGTSYNDILQGTGGNGYFYCFASN